MEWIVRLRFHGGNQECQRSVDCWSMDFISDALVDGCALRVFAAIDDLPRRCVGMSLDRRMILHVDVTTNTTAELMAQQWVEASPKMG